MEVVYSGFADQDVIRKGNWVVFKTSSSGKITNPLKEGMVRFIGQIFSVNSNYVKDSNGKLTTTYKISVREWSHILYCPVRYDPFVNAGQTVAAVVQNITADAYPGSNANPIKVPYVGNINFQQKGKKDSFQVVPVDIPPNENKISEPKDAAAITQEMFINYRQPFSYVGAILALISNMNKAADSLASVFDAHGTTGLIHTLDSHYKVVSRSASIPVRLVKDHVYTSSDIGNYQAQSPLSTGFLWLLSGVPKWDQNKDAYDPKTGLYDLSQFRGSKMVNLVYSQSEVFRPGTMLDPKSITEGMTTIDAINGMCENSAYDFYTDLWYTEVDGVIKVAPVLVVRDKPFSIKAYKLKYPQSANSKYKWTMFDDLPQLTVRPSSIQGINQTTNILESVNYIRVIPNTNGMMDGQTQAAATFAGTAVVPSQQYRFGGKEMVVSTYCGLITPGGEGTTPTYDTMWFSELRNRIVEWNSNNHLWSRMTITLKDSDYPFSVGDNIRIPLGQGKPILIGHLESIDYRLKCEETGLLTNQVYLTLSRVGMQDQSDNKDYNGKIVPLPESASVMLHRVTSDEPSGINAMVQAAKPAN
jgi:hypothetical protein